MKYQCNIRIRTTFSIEKKEGRVSMKPGNFPNIYDAIPASKLRSMLSYLVQRRLSCASTTNLKINSERLIGNLQFECYREIMVSYIPMLPILTLDQVPIKDADYILYMNPYARCDDVSECTLQEIREIANERKQGAEIIVVGKAANAEPLLNGSISNITFYGDHFTEKLGKRFNFNIGEQYFIFDDEQDHFAMWPVDGCLNECKFCRRSYMNIKFESIDLDTIKHMLDTVRQNHPEHLKHISLRAENIAEYGLDLYKRPMLHKLIALIDSYEEVETIDIAIGLSIAETTDEILNAICNSKKFRSIQMNPETGSDRLLQFIGKNHTCKDAIRIFKAIRAANPDIKMSSTIMLGLPTEEEMDILQLAKLIGKIEIDILHINYFVVAPRQPLAKYAQISREVREAHLKLLINALPQYLTRDIKIDHDMIFEDMNSAKTQEELRALEEHNKHCLFPEHYVQYHTWNMEKQKWIVSRKKE